MATYLVLMTWTDEGAAAFKDSPARAEAGKQEMAKLGVELREIFWTVGPYDVVLLCEAPDEESMTAALLRLASAGHLRTTTLRAFNREEFDRIAGRMV